jgi:rod shape-determining protein MreD
MERSAINPYFAGALLLTVALLQTSVMPNFLLLGVVPDLMLLVIVSWTLLQGTRESIAWALAGGLLLDLLSGGPFGAITVSLSFATLVTGLGSPSVFQGTLWLPILACSVATGIYNIVYLLILQLSAHPVPWGTSLLQVTIPSMIANTLIMYPVYWSVRWLHQRIS